MKICDYIENICDELDGAENYATMYIIYKQDKPRWSSIFGNIARQELEHAEMLMKIGKEYFEALSWKNEEMEEKWEKCQKKYANKLALVDTMLSH